MCMLQGSILRNTRSWPWSSTELCTWSASLYYICKPYSTLHSSWYNNHVCWWHNSSCERNWYAISIWSHECCPKRTQWLVWGQPTISKSDKDNAAVPPSRYFPRFNPVHPGPEFAGLSRYCPRFAKIYLQSHHHGSLRFAPVDTRQHPV